jgi:hypothetical protein
MRWSINLTGRNSSELPEALRIAMQRAKETGAGIQVVREILMPGLASKRAHA